MVTEAINNDKVYIYTRVSTSMQVDGFSLDAQRDEIMRYAQYRNMRVCGEYTDEGKSGKNIAGRPGFQSMIEDIKSKKDGVSYVICFKLSRFGRNTADILNSLKVMKRSGANLICVKENLDSSQDSGKMMISILGAMAEIERDNISVQTMAGRNEKARQGGWNGSKPPYGYKLIDGELVIIPEEAEQIKLIFDKYVNSYLGFMGVAKWMNEHGYVKNKNTYNGLSTFTEHFVRNAINNYTYIGKISYGKRKTVLKDNSEDEYHKIETDDFGVYDGKHEAIVSEELWEAAQKKAEDNAHRRQPRREKHVFMYSSLIKCPICGKNLYGMASRDKKKKDGTLYPTYYSYACRSHQHINGIKCGFGQLACSKIDDSVDSILKGIVNNENFGELMSKIILEKIDTKEVEKELNTANKIRKQASTVQKKIENELLTLDVLDKYYDRKYDSLNRRLEETFADIEDADDKIAECEARMEAIKNQMMSKDSVIESLKIFDKYYDKMSDLEKQTLARTFIDKIEIYPDKHRSGTIVKSIKFKFPVSYDGKAIFEISTPQKNTDETVVLLRRRNVQGHIDVELDVEEFDSVKGRATYEQIKAYIKDKYGLTVSTLNIAQIKDKMGIVKRENYNRGSGDGRVPNCTKEKEEAIIDAFKQFKII